MSGQGLHVRKKIQDPPNDTVADAVETAMVYSLTRFLLPFFINPFRALSSTRCSPGTASNASRAPPTTKQTALPVLFLQEIYTPFATVANA